MKPGPSRPPAPHTTRYRAAADIAVVVSRYNASVTDRLRDGAVQAWASRREALGLGELTIVDAPGSFELSVLSAEAARTGRFAGVVALGCLVKGDTRHDEYIAHAVANGLTAVSIQTGVPVAFGLITALTPRQARDRAGGPRGNKGREAMDALLDTLTALHALRADDAVTPGAGAARPRPDKTLAPARRSPRSAARRSRGL
ncbi:MAG: 6,7-dimethyl-8-ribityllumazine synthase [Phycisphaerales bacterium]